MHKEPMRLIKNGKKGFFRIFFSRVPLVLLLLILQILIFLSAFSWFREYFRYYSVFQLVFTVIMVSYLHNNSMDSAAKLTWMVVIALFPLPGSIFLLFSQSNPGYRGLKRRMDLLTDEIRECLPQDPVVREKLAEADPGLSALGDYVRRTGPYPVFDNSSVRYFPLGEDAFQAMLEELEKAQKFIFLEFFIVEEGEMWGRTLEILTEKVRQGVEVRLMYDGTCELSHLPASYPRRVEALGIQCKVFSPLLPFVSTTFNYRDHRKILVIDGQVAYTGGINMADEYINVKDRFGHWKDAAVELRGDAVRSFTLMFLQMWHAADRSMEPTAPYLAGPAAPVDRAAGFVLPYGDSPLDMDKVGETVYMDILYRAKRYVHIMTPYLILDGELEAAIKYAAERGVDVSIILPGRPDKIVAWSLAKTHYASLLRSGVKLYEYSPGFVHAKVFVSDDERAVVGTINLDYRSLYHHFECAAYLSGTDCIGDIEADFLATREKCLPVSSETIRREKPGYRLLGTFAKIIAPLM